MASSWRSMATADTSATAVTPEAVAGAALRLVIATGVMATLAGSCAVGEKRGAEVAQEGQGETPEVLEYEVATQLLINSKLVKAGMTYQEVVRLLGEPMSIRDGLGPSHKQVFVSYSEGSKAYTLNFENGLDGKLTSVWFNYGY